MSDTPYPLPHPDQQSLHPRLLDRWLAGECTESEGSAVAAWLDADLPRREVMEGLRVRVTAPFAYPVVTSPQVVWERLRPRAEWSAGRAVDRGVFSGVFKGMDGSGERRWRRTLWYIGAAVGIVCLGIVTGRNVGMPVFTGQPSRPVSVYTTANGQRANITLTDGTIVALNVASRLDVPADYPTGNHTVRLVGEALFTVAHQSGAPFTVLAGTVATRVLGTSFAVRRYDTDTTTTVAVREGKVAVQSAVLTADQQLEIGRSGISRMRPADPARFSFEAGMLTLSGMSLRDAIPELNRWYDADIRLGDPTLALQRIQGKVMTGSLPELATMLALTFDVRVVRDGRVLTLYPK